MLTRRTFLRRAFWMPPTLLLMRCSSGGSGVTVKLDHGPVAKLGEVMVFMMTATSAWDAPAPDDPNMPSKRARIIFSVSPGLSVPDPSWQVGTIVGQGTNYSHDVVFKAKTPQHFEIQVRLDEPGEQWIQATAGVGDPGNSSDSNSLFLKVDSGGTIVQGKPFSQ